MDSEELVSSVGRKRRRHSKKRSGLEREERRREK